MTAKDFFDECKEGEWRSIGNALTLRGAIDASRDLAEKAKRLGYIVEVEPEEVGRKRIAYRPRVMVTGRVKKAAKK